MNYPLISQYVEAICDAENSLDRLRHLRPVMDKYGSPTRSSGAFAVVFKMEDPGTGKLYALKCFTEEQRGRAEAYRAISEELQYASGRYFTTMRYYEDELFVDTDGDDTSFPVLLMDWVEGETMESYIAQHYNDTYEMSCLTYEFCKMASWLRSQPFAHGDIKPDNIMVREDGTLSLIDYDGMFVPSMKGQKSPTLGTADFRHSERTVDDFDETIDDFTLASMALSLKAISLKPELATKYGTTDKLLFSEADYKNLGASSVMRELLDIISDKEISRLYSLFLMAYSRKNLSAVSFREFIIEKPEEEILSTEVTDEDLEDCIEDEYEVKYSKDWKRLLKAPWEIENYIVHDGTKVICNGAFESCDFLKSISLPDSVMAIGKIAFNFCRSLELITIPSRVTTIKDCAFEYCSSLESITLPSSLKEIKGNPFSGLSIEIINKSSSFLIEDEVLYTVDKKRLIACLSYKFVFNVPQGVKIIGDYAFSRCEFLESIIIPNGVEIIGNEAFSCCESLESITIPDSITTIGDGAFIACKVLKSITLPKGVTTVGDAAFLGCSSLESIIIPNGVEIIGNEAFSDCISLESITIPDSVTTIGELVFVGCKSLKSITLSNGLTAIGDFTFCDCKSLELIIILNNVTTIGKYAFSGCESLKSISIPDSVMSISDGAFSGCKSLKEITLPLSLKEIKGNPFSGLRLNIINKSSSFYIEDGVLYTADKKRLIACVSLIETFYVPNGVEVIGDGAFSCCESLESITIPDSVTAIENSAFEGCKSLNNNIKEELRRRFGIRIFY